MRTTNVMETLTKLDVLACLTGAIGHDVDHPGVNQAFEKAIKSDIALMHNFRSVLENHHLNVLLSVLKLDMANIFINLDVQQRDECVDTIVDGVLSTDISRHFELSSLIQAKLRNKDFKLPTKKLDERRMCTMALLKMSDISNPMKPFETARWWADVVLKEFHAQGDLEASLGLPISPLCDRATGDMASSQIGFAQYLVRPFYKLCSELFSGLEPIIDVCDENLSIWEERKEQTALAKRRSSSVETKSTVNMDDMDDMEKLRSGTIIGLDAEMMQDMDKEVVALHIINGIQGKKLSMTGDLQEFVDTVLDVTDAQTAVLYWHDMYNKGRYTRVATTAGYTHAKEGFTLDELKGVTGDAVQKSKIVRVMWSDNENQVK